MFESSASTDEDTVNAYITIVSESLCPALLFMMKDAVTEASMGGDDESDETSSVRDSKNEAEATRSQEAKIQRQKQTGTEEENTKKGMDLLEFNAGGSLFPCPPPSDPVNVPANINARIQRTVKFLFLRIKRASDKVQDAMNCKKKSKSEQKKDKEKEAKEDQNVRQQLVYDDSGGSKNADQYTQPISKEDRAIILKLRANTLTQSMKNPGILNQIAAVKNMSDSLLATKKAAEENKIKPTCSKEEKGQGDNVQIN